VTDASPRSGSVAGSAARDYASIRIDPALPRDDALRAVIHALWDAFGISGSVPTRSHSSSIPAPYSWVGFYFGPGAGWDGARAGDAEMILGPRLPKPACSPIGLQGACGRCFLSGRPLVVRDVAALGANYIACDPRDRSEVVVPFFCETGETLGVLDVDSFEVGAFTEHDAMEVVRLLRRCGVCRSTGSIACDVVG
jgi:putative methionine-R-sulfoxide reductase with GAF domain